LKTADQIRALLGHKAEETHSSDQRHLADISTLVASGKMIEAIKVLREAEGIGLTDAKQRVDELHRRRAARHPRNQR
jgi:ribosomal protein L7/L12